MKELLAMLIKLVTQSTNKSCKKNQTKHTIRVSKNVNSQIRSDKKGTKTRDDIIPKRKDMIKDRNNLI